MAKKKKKKTNSKKRGLSEGQVDHIIHKASRDLQIISIVAAAMAVNDTFGFGKKRIRTLVARMEIIFGDFYNNHFSSQEAYKWLEDYAGIAIEDNGINFKELEICNK